MDEKTVDINETATEEVKVADKKKTDNCRMRVKKPEILAKMSNE